VAILDDLANQPVEVPIDILARARSRIGKFRNRLLHLQAHAQPPTADQVRAATAAGLDLSVDGFDHPRTRNFSLDALGDWSARLRGTGKDSWATVFPRGHRLWAGLASIHQCTEHYGSGGGLLRPQVAAGLRDAADRLGDAPLAEVAARYDDLAAQWTELARSALPDDVPVLRRTRELQDRRARLYAEHGPDAADEIAATWVEQAAIKATMTDAFPLDEAATRSLLDGLASRVDAIHEDELAALETLREAR